jgi:hypothetical protein
MKPAHDILQFGTSFRYEVFYLGKRFVSDSFSTREGAEFALKKHLLGIEGQSRSLRLEQILFDMGTACCRMAYKLTYCSGMPLERVSEMLGVSEDQAEQASQAGEYSLREYSIRGRLAKAEAERIIDTYFEQGFCEGEGYDSE